MTKSKGFSLRPSAKTNEDATEFIQSANNDPTDKEGKSDELKPWQDPRVRDDMMVMISLRLSEPYALKLKYLSEVTHLSQQEILRRIVLPYLDEEVGRY